MIVLIRRLPTAAFEAFHGGKWHCGKRTDDSHFVVSGLGKLTFPMQARITSIIGETLGSTIDSLINDKDQDSGVQYKSFKEGMTDCRCSQI